MNATKTKIALSLYVLVAFLDIIGRFLESYTVDLLFKPLLMPILFVYFLFHIQKPIRTSLKLIGFAIIFSWLGDVALIFESKHELAFILGLGSFLIAHFLYIFAYRKMVIENNTNHFILKNKWTIIPFILLFAGFYIFLLPNLRELAIPVFVYALSIILMVILALNRKETTSIVSYRNILIGAILFLISDAIIAINKFVIDVPSSGVWIMILYISAQYLILKGAIQHQND